MPRVLFTATLVRGHIAKFHIPYLKWFKEQGWETWVAARNDYPDGVCEIPYCDHYVDVPFSRSPYNLAEHIHATRLLKDLMSDTYFDLVHTHTPVGGVLTRLAAKGTRRRGTKVLYTAHGFHFYKGAPLSAWLIWYPIERYMSRHADALITINEEDYARAQQFSAGKTYFTHGTGVDVSVFGAQEIKEEQASTKRELLKGEDGTLLLAIGDVNRNKNHKVLLDALIGLPENCHLAIAGVGPLQEKLERRASKAGLAERVTFLGFRDDVPKLLNACDIFCMPSKREGLSISLVEGMASETLCLGSAVRGVSDLLAKTPECLVGDNSASGWTAAIGRILSMKNRDAIIARQYNSSSKYALENTLAEYEAIYVEQLNGKLGVSETGADASAFRTLRDEENPAA